ncbi:MAG: helix-turn-helix transcriptional regulator [Candidatus Levybacteria bacterium]|nr:helix-turn-helix transcriptional regulator [Candidatus Levybacteria bacterium]
MRVNSRKIKSIGDRVQKARKNKDITQERLAEMVGVSTGYIGFIEQGQRMPSIKTADKLARVLGVKLSDLFE